MYTKEDMQNNKFIFTEQQKIAIKLSKALELTKEQFRQYNVERNEPLRKAYDLLAKKSGPNATLPTVLPSSEQIYFRDFHFLDERLIERNKSFDKPEPKKEPKQPLILEPKAPLKLKAPDSDSEEDKPGVMPMFSNQKDAGKSKAESKNEPKKMEPARPSVVVRASMGKASQVVTRLENGTTWLW